MEGCYRCALPPGHFHDEEGGGVSVRCFCWWGLLYAFCESARSPRERIRSRGQQKKIDGSTVPTAREQGVKYRFSLGKAEAL